MIVLVWPAKSGSLVFTCFQHSARRTAVFALMRMSKSTLRIVYSTLAEQATNRRILGYIVLLLPTEVFSANVLLIVSKLEAAKILESVRIRQRFVIVVTVRFKVR